MNLLAFFQSVRAWSVLPRRPSAVPQALQGGARVRNENLCCAALTDQLSWGDQ